MKKATLILLTIIALACAEDYYPPGLLGYQVERLLTGGDEKLWYVQRYVVDGADMPVADCQDSVWLYFAVRGSRNNDSLVAYEIRRGPRCELYDSLYYGSFYASGGDEAFRDSLVFEGGALNFAMVQNILSSDLSLNFRMDGQDIFIQARGVDSLDAISADGIMYVLTGEAEGGASRQFYRSSYRLNNQLQVDSLCTDSLRILFRVEDNQVRSYGLERTQDCDAYDTTFLGNVRASASSTGAFSDTLFFAGGELDTVLFELTSNTSFSMRYTEDSLSYNSRFRLEE